MHQNWPTIADLKKFPGEKPPDPGFWVGHYAEGGEGKGRDGRWVEGEGEEEGRREGERGRGGDGLEPPPPLWNPKYATALSNMWYNAEFDRSASKSDINITLAYV